MQQFNLYETDQDSMVHPVEHLLQIGIDNIYVPLCLDVPKGIA